MQPEPASAGQEEAKVSDKTIPKIRKPKTLVFMKEFLDSANIKMMAYFYKEFFPNNTS